ERGTTLGAVVAAAEPLRRLLLRVLLGGWRVLGGRGGAAAMRRALIARQRGAGLGRVDERLTGSREQRLPRGRLGALAVPDRTPRQRRLILIGRHSSRTPIQMVLGDVLHDTVGDQVPHREAPADTFPA